MNARRLVVAGFIAAVAGFVAVPAGDAAAAGGATMGAGLNLRAGAHHPISRTMHAGDWIIGGRPVTCVTYGLATGTGPLSVGAPIGMPDGASAIRAAYVASVTPATLRVVTGSALAGDRNHVAAWRWFSLADMIAARPGAQPTSQARAAATNLRADLPWYLTQISAADRAAVKAILAESGKHAGRYAVTVTAPKSSPGTTVASTVTVTSGGKGMAGIPVTVAAVGARVAPATVTTDRSGRATVRVTPTAFAYTVSARASVPGGFVYRTPVVAGRQSMIGGTAYVSVSGSACATVCPVRARVVIDAGCDDDGKHKVDVMFTADPVPGSYRGWVVVGGRRSDVDLAAGETRTVTAQLADGQRIEAGFDVTDSGRTVVTRTLYVGGGV